MAYNQYKSSGYQLSDEVIENITTTSTAMVELDQGVSRLALSGKYKAEQRPINPEIAYPSYRFPGSDTSVGREDNGGGPNPLKTSTPSDSSLDDLLGRRSGYTHKPISYYAVDPDKARPWVSMQSTSTAAKGLTSETTGGRAPPTLNTIGTRVPAQSAAVPIPVPRFDTVGAQAPMQSPAVTVPRFDTMGTRAPMQSPAVTVPRFDTMGTRAPMQSPAVTVPRFDTMGTRAPMQSPAVTVPRFDTMGTRAPIQSPSAVFPASDTIDRIPVRKVKEIRIQYSKLELLRIGYACLRSDIDSFKKLKKEVMLTLKSH